MSGDNIKCLLYIGDVLFKTVKVKEFTEDIEVGVPLPGRMRDIAKAAAAGEIDARISMEAQFVFKYYNDSKSSCKDNRECFYHLYDIKP